MRKLQKIVHKKCYKTSNFSIHNSKQMCPTCALATVKRYNPFDECCDIQSNTDNNSDQFYNSEPHNEIPIMRAANNVLDKCKSYPSTLMKALGTEFPGDFTPFYNIDGNKSNFDMFISQLSTLAIKLSAVGLVETNIGKDERTELLKIDGFKSFYNEKIQGKSKGTGAALYIDETLNAIENEKLCLISPDIESLFVTVNDSNKKINIGSIYRSPSGDEEKFLEDFLSLIEQFPKNTTSIIMGDFNFDLFKDFSQ